MSKNNHTGRSLGDATALVVHLVDTDDFELAALFGGETGDEIDKFARCEWSPGPFDVPVLDASQRSMAGSIRARHDGGDHTIAIVDITHAHDAGAVKPLTFQHGRVIDAGHDA